MIILQTSDGRTRVVGYDGAIDATGNDEYVENIELCHDLATGETAHVASTGLSRGSRHGLDVNTCWIVRLSGIAHPFNTPVEAAEFMFTNRHQIIEAFFAG